MTAPTPSVAEVADLGSRGLPRHARDEGSRLQTRAARERVLARLGLQNLVGIEPIENAEAHLAHAVSLGVPGRFEVDGLKIEAPAGVYHPRPESSSLMFVRNILALNPPKFSRALEIGTGSGAVALFLAHRFGADVIATDIAEIALDAAKANAEANSVAIRILRSDLFEDVRERDFDLIVFNTPMVDQAPVTQWDGGTLCDPGGDLLERFANQVGDFLAPNGVALFSLSSNAAYEKLEGVDLRMRIVGFEMEGAGFWRAIVEARRAL
jgi:methylase of polypeptide subunit release factors